MRVAVVAEYYPRPSHPGLGIWAHRQALAVREQGVEVTVLALERPLPPLRALRALGPQGRPDPGPLLGWLRAVRAQPRTASLDGLPVRYLRFLSPPRPLSYGSWGRWAAPVLARALDDLDRARPLNLVHAHYAVPSGDAVRRWIARRRPVPLVVSVHGGDLSYAAPRSERGRAAVDETLRDAAAVIANSELTRAGIAELTGRRDGVHVVHPGADVPAGGAALRPDPTLVTVAHLEPHKSQADVIRALAALRERHPSLRYLMIGDGPDRRALEQLARSLGVGERVTFTGELSHEHALAELARCHVHVMPSRHDAFGVAHLEAMAAGLPTVASLGTGAEDIAQAGEGVVLVRAGDVSAITRALDELLTDSGRRQALGDAARKTVALNFSWERNGAETVGIYRSVTAA
jgi:teichuronic acid biosynthesis glycosyltransferase TuaC